METNTLPAEAFRCRAEVRLGSNGNSAKTAPVKIIGNSGEVHDHWFFGPQVFDFAGMTVAKAKIPLDYEHGEEIGYLNKFDTSTGVLVCNGAIVPVSGDQSDVTLQKMVGGVPYEASIQWTEDSSFELLTEGQVAMVNGNTVAGPVLVWRNWGLNAVAICKLGADPNTSSLLAASKAESEKHKGQMKGLLLCLSKTKQEKVQMTENTIAEATEVAVEAKAVEVTPVAVETVEAEAKEPQVATEVTAEADTKVEAVEAQKSEEVVEETVKAEEAVMVASKTSDDPRAEARKFVASFGETQGFKYFADGKTFDQAAMEHVTFQAAEINELKKRLSAIDRGAEKAVKFTSEEVAVTNKASHKHPMTAAIRMPGQDK